MDVLLRSDKRRVVFLGGLRFEQWQAFVDMIGKYEEWGAGEWKNMMPFMPKDAQLNGRSLCSQKLGSTRG